MNRTLRNLGIAVLAIAVVGVGATALAQRHMGPHGMQQHVARFIDHALDAAKADPAQRQRITAARDRAFTSLQGVHQQRRGQMKEALALFEADTLDAARLDAIKAARLGEMQQAGDAIVAALTEAHDALRPEQRKAVVDYLGSHKPRRGHAFRADMMKRFATTRIDDLLDEVEASDAQRAAIDAARDHVFSTLDEAMGGSEGQLHQQALALFQADQIDSAKIQALRAEHQAKASKIGDALVQAFHDVHDALTPAQRKQVADEIRAHARHFNHGEPAAAGPSAG